MTHHRLTWTLLPLASIALLSVGCGDQGSGDSGTITTTVTLTNDDTGTTDVVPVWSDVSLETAASITGVYAASSDEAWITMSGGTTRLWQAGAWSTLSLDVDDQDLNGMWGSGSSSGATVVAVGDAGYIATWGSGGWDLTDVGTANFESVDGASSSDLIAVGWGGIYENASGDWAFNTQSGGKQLNHVWYDGSNAAAVGEDGVLGIRSSDKKGEWQWTQDKERRAFYGVSGTGADDIYAVGEAGVVLHWDGSAWTDISPGSGKSIWGVWAANASNVYIVGNSGLAMIRSGDVWTDLPTGATSNLYAVHGTGVSDVWAVGGQGLALRYQP